MREREEVIIIFFFSTPKYKCVNNQCVLMDLRPSHTCADIISAEQFTNSKQEYKITRGMSSKIIILWFSKYFFYFMPNALEYQQE